MNRCFQCRTVCFIYTLLCLDRKLELVVCNFISGWNQRFRLCGCYTEVDKIFCSRLGFQTIYRYGEFFRGLRSNIQRYFSTFYCLSVSKYIVVNLIFFQVSEIETVGDFEYTGCGIYCFKTYILMYIFHFSHCRMRTTIRIDKTVAEEVAIARRVYTEVTSVGPVFSSILIFLEKTLVYPVPDISTLEIRIFVNCLPLSPQVSRGVSHGMCILRRSYRTVATILSDIFQPVGTRILRNIHIGVPFPLSTFVVDRTIHQIFVCLFQPQISLIEIISVSGFISQRPECNARIIIITFKHIDGTIHVRFQPFGIVTQ